MNKKYFYCLGTRNYVQKRSLSVQTGKELLLGVYEPFEKFAASSVIRLCTGSNEKIADSKDEMCMCNQRISKSSDNLQDSKADMIDEDNQTFLNSSLVSNTISSELNLSFDRSEGSEQLSRYQLNFQDLTELDTKSLIAGLRKR